MEWTIERVKAELPVIEVLMAHTGEFMIGRVTGRQLLLAHVTVYLPHYDIYYTEEYQWDTLAQLLNEGKHLTWGKEVRSSIRETYHAGRARHSRSSS